ncbi:hypothetical protein GW17_00026782 [Ensete ventricosum]|nr:hypothetical protein GW17_00026782 [Ensete ventricosum]
MAEEGQPATARPVARATSCSQRPPARGWLDARRRPPVGAAAASEHGRLWPARRGTTACSAVPAGAVGCRVLARGCRPQGRLRARAVTAYAGAATQ